MPGANGLMLWESIACAGDLRCAESLLSAISLIFHLRCSQAPDGFCPRELAGVRDRTYLHRALYICCERGHVELLEFLLAEFADEQSKSLGLSTLITEEFCGKPLFHLGKWAYPEPLAYAVAFNRHALLSHLLPHISLQTQPLFKLPTISTGAPQFTEHVAQTSRSKVSRKRAHPSVETRASEGLPQMPVGDAAHRERYHIEISELTLLNWIVYSGAYNAFECARLVVDTFPGPLQAAFQRARHWTTSGRIWIASMLRGPQLVELVAPFVEFALASQELTENFLGWALLFNSAFKHPMSVSAYSVMFPDGAAANAAHSVEYLTENIAIKNSPSTTPLSTATNLDISFHDMPISRSSLSFKLFIACKTICIMARTHAPGVDNTRIDPHIAAFRNLLAFERAHPALHMHARNADGDVEFLIPPVSFFFIACFSHLLARFHNNSSGLCEFWSIFVEHLEQFDAAIRIPLYALLCCTSAVADSQPPTIKMSRLENTSITMRLHNLLAVFNARLVDTSHVGQLTLMITDASRMVLAYTEFPAFRQAGPALTLSIAELGNLRLCIERADPLAAIAPLSKLPSVWPVAHRVEIVKCTLDAYSPIVLSACAPLEGFADGWMFGVVRMLQKNEEDDSYLVELMRRTLLACTPASAAALIRLFSRPTSPLKRFIATLHNRALRRLAENCPT